MKVTVLSLFLILAFAIPTHTQDYEVAVTTVRVWVSVQGSPQVIGAMTQKDFDVFEDNKKMTPTCFEKAPILASTVAEAEPDEDSEELDVDLETQPVQAGPSLKRIVLMIDQLNTSQNEYLFIKGKLDEFLGQVRTKAEVMLVGLPPYEALVPFTHDISEIRHKLEDLEVNRNRDQTMNDHRRAVRNMLQRGQGLPQRGQYIQEAYKLALQFQQEETQEFLTFLQSVKAFGKYLEKEDQSEHTVVILVSGGLNSTPGQQYIDMVTKDVGVEESTRSFERVANRHFDQQIQQILGALNRDNVTIYTINTRGQVDIVDNIIESDQEFIVKHDEDYSKDYQDVLNHIAEQTGGISFRNSLNFKKGFDGILTDLENQYLICYAAPEHKKQGEYHKIKVETKASGVNVRYRAGYMD